MKDFRLFALSFCFIFSVFCAYAILRPVCDALGIHGSTDELKWLFLGTFVFTLFGSFVAVWASGRLSKGGILTQFLAFCSKFADFLRSYAQF